MPGLADQFTQFFKEQRGFYVNPNHTVFIRQGKLILATSYIHFEKSRDCMVLLNESRTISAFIARHRLKSVEGIDQVDGKLLWELYLKGQGETSYIINGSAIAFKRLVSANRAVPLIQVKSERHDFNRVCQEALATPDDHMAFIIRTFIE